MLNLLQRFAQNRAGNTLLIFALTIPVVLAAIGGAIDFGRAVQLRVAMQDAADVASLGAVAINSAAYKVALQQGDGEITAGTAQAHDIYLSDMISAPELSTPIISTNVSKSGTVLTSKINVSANYKSYILGLVGLSTMPISVHSTSSSTIPPYIDFYLLLDNTPSMGLGATTTDITNLQNATSASKLKNVEKACAFACHESKTPGQDNYTVARNNNITLRIDVVREATQNLMTTAKSTETLNGQYRMAIYDFGPAADGMNLQVPTAYQVSTLTSDLSKSASDADNIDLMTIPDRNYPEEQTNFDAVLAYMNQASIISSPGNGTSAFSPQKVLFFVSDGFNDGYNCSHSDGQTCRYQAPINPASCKALKDRGIRVAVLYTTYRPITNNSWYNTYVAKFRPPKTSSDQIAGNMQSCASPGLYFEVGPDEGISEAMTALFNKVVQVVRIQQ